MTRSNTRSVLLAASAGLTAIALPSAAMAEGVPAGTPIDNTAEATYTIGGATETVPSNKVTVKVDEILDVAVQSLDAGEVVLTAAGAVLTFQVNNTGNGPEAYNIDVDPALTGDDFDPAIVKFAYDSNGNGVYDEGVDIVIPAGGSTPEIAADGSLRMFVITEFDGAAPGNGDTADVRLTATAVTGSGTPGTVFAGQGVDGVDAVVGLTTAIDDDIGTLIAQVSAVTLTKSATVLDPFGGSQTIPGSIVTYRLIARVSGSGSVDGLVVNDPIPVNTTYIPSTTRVGGVRLTDAADGDAVTADGTQVNVDLGTVAGGTSTIITFKVKIDE
ncbi:hypothetical protein ACFCW2_00575 [Qipengyuania sp. DSG2-2]|uniref:hypothetical protein n=1 Tax=Qipengyuania sp. DGS2-2 TaxID=3349631 RepID=UPI0036D2AB43